MSIPTWMKSRWERRREAPIHPARPTYTVPVPVTPQPDWTYGTVTRSTSVTWTANAYYVRDQQWISWSGIAHEWEPEYPEAMRYPDGI